jgi:hypothetical protein
MRQGDKQDNTRTALSSPELVSNILMLTQTKTEPVGLKLAASYGEA